jgi:hypothetical protein
MKDGAVMQSKKMTPTPRGNRRTFETENKRNGKKGRMEEEERENKKRKERRKERTVRSEGWAKAGDGWPG